MEGNNGNKSRQNQPVNKMEQAPTHHMERPRRAVRNAANARAAAQAAPQVRVSGPVRTRKAPRKNTPYARPSNNGAKNKANKTANNNMMKRFNTLSFGPSPIIASHSNPFTVMNHASSRAPLSFTPSSFAIAQNQKKTFQLGMKKAVAKQHDAYLQKQANITQHRRNGAKKAAVTRKAKKEALQAAAAAAMLNVQNAKQRVQQQAQSSSGVSANAERALATAQRAAQNADAAFRRALANDNNNNNGASAASSSASAASANNLSSMFGRL